MVHLLWTHAGLECRAGVGPMLDSTHHSARSKTDLRGNDGVGCARDKRSRAKQRTHSIALLQMWPLLLLLLLMLRCACCAAAASAGIAPHLTPAATPRQHPHLTLCCCCWTQTCTVPRHLVTLSSPPWAQTSYVGYKQHLRRTGAGLVLVSICCHARLRKFRAGRAGRQRPRIGTMRRRTGTGR